MTLDALLSVLALAFVFFCTFQMGAAWQRFLTRRERELGAQKRENGKDLP